MIRGARLMVKAVAGIAGRDQAERAPRGLTRGPTRGLCGLRRMAVAEVNGLGIPVTCTSAPALDTSTAELPRLRPSRRLAQLLGHRGNRGLPGSQRHRDGGRRRGGPGRCLRLLQRKNLDRRGDHAPRGGLHLVFPYRKGTRHVPKTLVQVVGATARRAKR